MTDREKLVKLLEAATKETVDGIRLRYKFETLEQFADQLIANGVTVDDDCKACAEATQECIVGLQEQITEMRKKLEWISVEDRLPEINVDVNICDSKNNVSTGCLSSRTTRERRLLWSTRHRGSKTDITHWMPLPEPLKEEKNDD